jgi:hypothetical protein
MAWELTPWRPFRELERMRREKDVTRKVVGGQAGQKDDRPSRIL